MRILVDMDGVIADYIGHMNTQLQRYGVGPLIPTAHDMWVDFPEHTDIITKVTTEPRFFANLPPLPGAIRALEQMAQEHDVRICSAPTRKTQTLCEAEKREWLAKYLGQHWADNAYITRDKTVVEGDILIDDKPDITGALANPKWKQILMDQPWNQGVNLPRLYNWENWKDVLAQYQK